MSLRPLLPGQRATAKGDAPSPELVEIIDRLVREVQALKDRVKALEDE